MYGSLRIKADFHDEVHKFIKAAEEHATTLTKDGGTIICPCKDCKNLIAFQDVTTIREHLIRQGFVSDYTVWIHHGETKVVGDNDDDQEYEAKTLEYMSQFTNELDQQMDRYFDNEQGHDFDNEQGGDDSGGAGNDDEAREGDVDDGDNFDEMFWAFGLEILLKSSKVLQNLDRVTKASKETVYGVEKGCLTHFTLLHFVLELLILKAKYG